MKPKLALRERPTEPRDNRSVIRWEPDAETLVCLRSGSTVSLAAYCLYSELLKTGYALTLDAVGFLHLHLVADTGALAPAHERHLCYEIAVMADELVRLVDDDPGQRVH
jgi:hypothetical protein